MIEDVDIEAKEWRHSDGSETFFVYDKNTNSLYSYDCYEHAKNRLRLVTNGMLIRALGHTDVVDGLIR